MKNWQLSSKTTRLNWLNGLFILCLLACNNKKLALKSTIQPILSRNSTDCSDNDAIKYIPVHIHFLLKDNGEGNFSEDSDGLGDSTYNGYQRARDLVDKANYLWQNNAKMYLPSGNNLPVLPIRIRLVLKGIHFHKNDNLYAKCQISEHFFWDFSFNKQLGENGENEMNLYFLNDEKDILKNNGIACSLGEDCLENGGLIAKMYDDWTTYKVYKEWSLFFSAANMNHEIGHLLGLQHSYQTDDNCPDTPPNNNCWGLSKNNPKCDDWTKISNNLMDYNEFFPKALTPCQINMIHQKLSSNLKKYVMSCDSCETVSPLFYTQKTNNNLIMNVLSPKESNELYKLEIYNENGSYANYYSSAWHELPQKEVLLNRFYVFEPNNTYILRLFAKKKNCEIVKQYEKRLLSIEY